MNNWYALQCVSGKEHVVRDAINRLFCNYSTFFPRRELEIRKNGQTSVQVKALFPGYLFIKSGSRLMYREAMELIGKINERYATATLLKVVGMYRHKESIGSDEITPIEDREIDLFLNIANEDEVVRFSQYKKEGDRVQIIGGPLSGREGIVIKTNPRKKRIKVGVTLLGEMQIIDLGAELVI